ncbi:FAD-binding oxidoreductase, partial [Campylobacter jejuni]
RLATMQQHGYTHEQWIDREELLGMIPALTPTVEGGLIAREDAAADPYRTTLAFRRKAASLGARFLEGVRVLRSAHEQG